MRRKQALVLAIGMLGMLGVPQAQAAHCNSVGILTGEGLVVDAGSVGCTVQEASGLHTDTDFIVPGSSYVLVVSNDATAPSGNLSATGVDITDCDAAAHPPGDPGVANSCTLTWTGVDDDLPADGIFDHYESQFIRVARASTVAGGSITATVTATATESRTYLTVG